MRKMPYYEVKPLQTLRGKKILEEVHPLDIIREVQRRPSLYERDCPERASAHHRAQLWADVARAVMPDWDAYSSTEKQNRLSDLMKKWRNLRDTFKRHLEVEKKIRNGLNIKKKTYVYFNHMSFLRAHLGEAEEEAPAPRRARRLRVAVAPAATAATAATVATVGTVATAATAATVATVATSAVAPVLAREEIDEDHHFLMSLVPSFRRMTDDEKLSAKMEILKVIQNVRGQNKFQDETEVLGRTAEISIKQETLMDIEPEFEVDLEDGDDSGGDDSD